MDINYKMPQQQVRVPAASEGAGPSPRRSGSTLPHCGLKIGPKLAIWFLKLDYHSCESHIRIPLAYT